MKKRSDGRAVCKDCFADWQETHERAEPDDIPAAKLRPAPHPGRRCTTHHRARRKSTRAAAQQRRDSNVYGLLPGDYETILERQGGKCALCRIATGRARRLSVDHDHTSGLVRGLLCRPCNSLLGIARDATEFFQRAIDYLTAPPAAFLQRYVVTAPVKGREED